MTDDGSLFIRRTSRGCTILLIYVDDMIISGNDVVGISNLKSHLMRTFKMNGLGFLTYFLGLEVSGARLSFGLIKPNMPMI